MAVEDTCVVCMWQGITDIQPNKWYTELTVALQVSVFGIAFFYMAYHPDVAEFSLLCLHLDSHLSQKNTTPPFHLGKE